MKHLQAFVFVLAALIVGEASADELMGTLKSIKETGTITLGYRESSIPFSYLDDTRPPDTNAPKEGSGYQNLRPIGFAMVLKVC